MPVSTFRHPQLLQPEGFNVISKDHFAVAPAAKPAKRERKRVTFKPRVSVRPTIHISEYSEEEMKDIWFCRSDFSVMKAAFAHTVRMISRGTYKGDDEDNCARGLEQRSRKGSLARRENKTNGLDAVLFEQRRQQHHGIVNAELIRQAYVKENVQCRLTSLKRGIRDQEEAVIIHEEVHGYSFSDNLDDDSYSSDEEMDYCDMHQLSIIAKEQRLSSQQRPLAR